MKIELENVLPADIERRSMEIIGSELPHPCDPKTEPIVKRAIHTSADFDYLDNLVFSKDVVDHALEILQNHPIIITDTNMAKSGINKAALEKLGGEVHCFMADPDIAAAAKANGTTRATAIIDKAATMEGNIIFAIGNAPTALVRIVELHAEGKLNPALVIGVPVGFVNVVQSKELIIESDMPHIVARGRKGGSNIAAAIVNALMYMITRK